MDMKETVYNRKTVAEVLRKVIEQIESSEELGVVGYSIQYDGKGNLLELRLTRDYMEKIGEEGYDRLSWKRYTEGEDEDVLEEKSRNRRKSMIQQLFRLFGVFVKKSTAMKKIILIALFPILFGLKGLAEDINNHTSNSISSYVSISISGDAVDVIKSIKLAFNPRLNANKTLF